jgi:hypothetical protein
LGTLGIGQVFGQNSNLNAILSAHLRRQLFQLFSLACHLLANNLGFLFPPFVGLWAGWVRRSWPWAMAGSIIGFVIGGRYYLLCGHNSLAVMMAFPCLLGSAACVALGIGERSWRDRNIARYGKGLAAGLVLGSGTNSSPKRRSGRPHAVDRLVPAVEIVALPLAILEAFHRTDDPCQDWGRLLKFLSPITIAGGLAIEVSR